MIKSLRLRLMIWQSLLLLLIVCGFGTVVYLQSIENIFSQIDTELLGGARVIEGTLRAYVEPPDEQDLRPQRSRRGPPRFPEEILTSADIPSSILQLPREMMRGPRHRDQVYFVVFDFDGNVIQQSPGINLDAPRRPRREFKFQMNGRNREVVVNAPGGTLVLVGRGAGRQKAELRRLIMMLVISGASVMVVGLFGAWWLTGRAIRPIKKLSATADSITATNLKERITLDKLDNEFKSVSSTINSMVDRLATAIEQQRKFTADASHELRTPISILKMHAELALARQRTEAEYRTSLETCLRAGNRMSNLTDDLLELARADSGQLALNKTKVDLLKLTRDSIEFFGILAEKSQVDIHLKGEPAFCHADQARMRQLIDNLVKNSIIHNEEGGFVNIEVIEQGNLATICITNSGPVIPGEHLPNLFDRFYRVESSRSRDKDSVGGSGLGLSICKAIADAHGATLEIESGASQGTKVTLIIAVGNWPDNR